ncbi:MAG: hypothetical protein AB7F88_14825 [Pyrinomonadaceae bacterium]
MREYVEAFWICYITGHANFMAVKDMISVLPVIESQRKLLEGICDEFDRAIVLIESLEDEAYAGTLSDKGSTGAHFRHNMDIVSNLLEGLEAGSIDYESRDRDERVEKSRQFAVERIEQLISRLKKLPSAVLETMIAVRSEIDPGVSHLSSVARELEFIHSHTVHHHAMIAEKLRLSGVDVPSDFGVAPSTLRFWNQQSSRFPDQLFQVRPGNR